MIYNTLKTSKQKGNINRNQQSSMKVYAKQSKYYKQIKHTIIRANLCRSNSGQLNEYEKQ